MLKSNPVPDSGTVALAPSALEATVSVPVCALGFEGANTTLVVQVAPAARAVPQVLPLNLNPALAVRARLSSETAGRVFEIVTGIALLAVPTPVAGKFTCPDSICRPPVSPPVPSQGNCGCRGNRGGVDA